MTRERMEEIKATLAAEIEVASAISESDMEAIEMKVAEYKATLVKELEETKGKDLIKKQYQMELLDMMLAEPEPVVEEAVEEEPVVEEVVETEGIAVEEECVSEETVEVECESEPVVEEPVVEEQTESIASRLIRRF